MLRQVLGALCALFVGGCTPAVSPPPTGSVPLPPIRFLLTFDDGPSPDAEDNPTAKIADTLAANAVQPRIKAVFFVQTRWPGAGGSLVGRGLMRRLAAEGHILGLHSGSVRGHIDHPSMSADELATSLADGIADIKAIARRAPDLLRPPNWAFDARTLAAYGRAGLGMLLTDVSAKDGGPVVFQAAPELGNEHDGRIRRDLVRFRNRLGAGEIPTAKGVAPVVMTFHDTNRYTALHLTDYLSTLVRAADSVGLRVGHPPFYAKRAALWQAARARVQSK